MGNKGDKNTGASENTASVVLEKLNDIDELSSKKMFGGHGLFHQGKMFGMVDPKGEPYLKVNDTQRAIFEKKGATAHAKMPYVTIPDKIFNNKEEFKEWAWQSINLSKK